MSQQNDTLELRSIEHTVELREENGKPKLTGYAARFNEASHVLAGGFREILLPGAFSETLADDQNDVLALYNHDTGALLGRESAGTLRLHEDEQGLMYSIDPPDTQLGHDTVALVAAGNLKGASFAFRAHPDDEEYHRDGEQAIRTIKRLQVFEISIVSSPAYPTSTAAVRQRCADLFAKSEQVAQGDITKARSSPLAQAQHVARWLRREH